MLEMTHDIYKSMQVKHALHRDVHAGMFYSDIF